MSSGSKTGTRYTLSFSQKSQQMNPLQVPNQDPNGERDTCSQGICISLENLLKISLYKKAPRKKCPSTFPKSGAPTEADAHFRALLNISSGVPSKIALPQGPLHGTPRREMLHHAIHRAPLWGTWRRAHLLGTLRDGCSGL